MTSRLRHAKTAAFADFWYEAREASNGAVPPKPDLPMRAMAPFMSHISLTEQKDDAPHYVLCGTGLVREFGRDPTGTSVFDYMTEEAKEQLIQSFLDYAEKFGTEGEFGRWNIGHATTTTGRMVEYECLTFPYWEPSQNQIRHMTFAQTLATLDIGEGVAMRYPDTEAEIFDPLGPRPAWMHLR